MSSGKLGWPVLKCMLLIFASSASVPKQSQFKWQCQLSVQAKVPLQPAEGEHPMQYGCAGSQGVNTGPGRSGRDTWSLPEGLVPESG